MKINFNRWCNKLIFVFWCSYTHCEGSMFPLLMEIVSSRSGLMCSCQKPRACINSWTTSSGFPFKTESKVDDSYKLYINRSWLYFFTACSNRDARKSAFRRLPNLAEATSHFCKEDVSIVALVTRIHFAWLTERSSTFSTVKLILIQWIGLKWITFAILCETRANQVNMNSFTSFIHKHSERWPNAFLRVVR